MVRGKVLALKSGDLSSCSRTHMMEGKNLLHKLTFDLHTCT